MRIGVNCYNLQAANGGINHYFLMLFDELLQNDRDNEYVFLWFPQNSQLLERMQSDRWRKHALLLRSQRQIRHHLEGLDLYFCPLSVLRPRPVPLPSVLTIPDIQEAFLPELFTARALFSRERHFRGSTRMTDCVITHSEFTKRTLVEQHRLPPEKVLVAHHWPDRAFSDPSAGRAPRQALPDEFVLYPANFWKHKNHDALLQALRLLQQEQGLSIDLVLTGSHVPNGYPIEAKAKDYGVAARIYYLGFVPIQELVYLYRGARMLAFPSRFEGFGIPLVEAMAAGCPIVAANATAVPEIVGPAALLFDPTSPRAIADAMARLWRDEPLRRELSVLGKKEVERFALRAAKAHLAAFGYASRSHDPSRYAWHRFGYAPYDAALALVRTLQRAGTQAR